jgi:hypothetical protein
VVTKSSNVKSDGKVTVGIPRSTKATPRTTVGTPKSMKVYLVITTRKFNRCYKILNNLSSISLRPQLIDAFIVVEARWQRRVRKK